MKLKCNHARRALVLPSGNTVHRSDGSQCLGVLTIGGNKVTKMFTRNDTPDIPKGTLVLGVDPSCHS
jgi:hypothetical protein